MATNKNAMVNKKGETVAGAGKNVIKDPTKPATRHADPYTLVEDVNQGPGGARKGKMVPGHGQTSDEAYNPSQKVLIDQTLGQRDPYRAVPGDWPKIVTGSDARHGQGSGATWENRDAGGKFELAAQDPYQIGPRRCEDGFDEASGSGAPVPGNRSDIVDMCFPIEVSKGEADASGTETGIMESVNLQTGYVETSQPRTRVQEVPEEKVYIPSGVPKRSDAGLVQRELGGGSQGKYADAGLKKRDK